MIGSLALLAATLAGLVIGWRSVDIEIPLFGWVMIGAGSALTVALGVGLMWLSFYSARHGFDDQHPPDADL